MLVEVFERCFLWFLVCFYTFIEYGGYLGLALVCLPILRKVCYLFKQLTN